jgi:glyoxylase-like metal-dependent hydrolase (beta-lactamase superfamily II)
MDVIALHPQLHFLRFPVGHAYLWAGTDGLTLIDTGLPGSAPAIADAIRGLGHSSADVRRVVLTHAHHDHVGSVPEITGWSDDLTVMAHLAEAPAIRAEETTPPPQLEDWERPIFDQVTATIPAAQPVPLRVDRELDDGDAVDLGGTLAIAFSVPGHTPGSLALFLPKPGVLFTGDTVARTQGGDVIPGVFNHDPAQTRADLHRLAALDAEIACFGHGEPATKDAALELRAATARPSP